MKNSFRLNPRVSYRKKNGIYVFYYDYSYIFFTNKAAQLIDILLMLLNGKNNTSKNLPKSFLDYLKSKNIIEEI